MKEELNAAQATNGGNNATPKKAVTIKTENVVNSTDSLLQQLQQQQQMQQQLQPGESQTICLPGVTIHVSYRSNESLNIGSDSISFFISIGVEELSRKFVLKANLIQ